PSHSALTVAVGLGRAGGGEVSCSQAPENVTGFLTGSFSWKLLIHFDLIFSDIAVLSPGKRTVPTNGSLEGCGEVAPCVRGFPGPEAWGSASPPHCWAATSVSL